MVRALITTLVGVGLVTLTTGSSSDSLGYVFRGGVVVSRGTLHRSS